MTDEKPQSWPSEARVTSWKEIERDPLATHQERKGALMGDILRTAETGKAILVSGVAGSYLRASLYTQAKRLGLKARIIRKGENFICWCERVTPEGGAS